MAHMKKIISMMGALALIGTSLLSSVSADESTETTMTTAEVTSTSTESSDSDSDSNEATDTSESSNSDESTATDTDSSNSSVSATDTTSVENTKKIQDLYAQCMNYVKVKNISGIDCKAKIEEAQGKIRNERALLEQKLKEERKNIEQKNKEQLMEFKDKAKEQRQEFKQETKAKRKALSEKLHTQLVAAIENIALEKLNRVLSNIDKAVTKINASTLVQAKKDNFLAQLEEIRAIIQNKIDAMTGVSSETNIVDEVLS